MNGYVLRLNNKGDQQEPFAAAFGLLKDEYFPDNQTCWFGWNETEIRLPGKFDGNETRTPFDSDWDMARIFSAKAELRIQRDCCGQVALLLTENQSLREKVKQQTDVFEIAEHTFTSEPGRRIMVGSKPENQIGGEPDALIEVAFPRVLHYRGFAVEKRESLEARVQCYYDEAHRLRFVRYCAVEPKKKPTP